MRKFGLRSALLAAGMAVMAAPTIAFAYEGTGTDFFQIENALRGYGYYLDYHDGNGWASVFTPNAEFHDAHNCLIGRGQIAYLASHFGGGPGVEPKERHIVVPGPIVYQDKDHATMKNFVMVMGDVARGQKTGGGVMITGTYDDRLERVNGKWLIAYRTEFSPGDGAPKSCTPAAQSAEVTLPKEGYQGTGDDYAQIQHDLKEYSYALDHHDGPGWASVFTPDGEFHDSGNCLIGSAQIADVAAHFGQPRPPKPGEPPPPPRPPRPPSSGHLVQPGPVSFLDHDHAIMHSYIFEVSGGTRGGNDARVTVTGTYTDKLTRLNGTWLIANRVEYSPGDVQKACPAKS